MFRWLRRDRHEHVWKGVATYYDRDSKAYLRLAACECGQVVIHEL